MRWDAARWGSAGAMRASRAPRSWRHATTTPTNAHPAATNVSSQSMADSALIVSLLSAHHAARFDCGSSSGIVGTLAAFRLTYRIEQLDRPVLLGGR